MNNVQSRMMDDLAGLLSGELRCDPLSLALYATDASLYQIPPLAVIFPRNRDDVRTVVRYCSEMHIPMVARGAGSGVAGESLSGGVVIDFSRHMRRIVSIQEKSVVVEPGVVCEQLNLKLREHGRYFPPDPSGSWITTIGSMLALDAAGSHSIRVGSTRDHVKSLEFVLAGGDLISAGLEPLSQLSTYRPEPNSLGGDSQVSNHKRNILTRLVRLLRENERLIHERQPAELVRNRCGYFLRGILSETNLHLARMLVGTEGTLGIITEANLHTAPLPAHRGAMIMLFGQLESATKAVQILRAHQPSACDLLERRLLTLARDADPNFEQLIPPLQKRPSSSRPSASMNARPVSVCAKCRAVREGITSSVVAEEAYTPEDVEFLWTLPHTVVPLLTRLQGPTRPLPFVEDITVPPPALHELLVGAQNVFKKHDVIASLYAHAAAGQVHFRPFLLPPDAGTAHKLQELAHDLYHLVFSLGGSIGGEHGTGLARSGFLRDQYGLLYNVFREIKETFDPQNLMNPGKVISDDPHLIVRHLRPPATPVPDLVELNLRWNADTLAQAANRCNGCAACRTTSPDTRMCPVFRIDPIEDASPRAKANLMRGLVSGLLKSDDFLSNDMKRIANLCFNCKQCQLECPSNVNIPHLMIEAKAAYVAAHGLDRADWLLSWGHNIGALGSRFPWFSNWVISNPSARWILEKLTGISRHRKLPQFSRRTFMRYAQREWLVRPVRGSDKPPVAYFVDHYANHHDPQLARALVTVLRYHGIPVYVPPHQTGSGMAMVTAGDLDAARKNALRNLRELGELARDGMKIICTEPAAALCLKYEYPSFVDHPDVQVLADSVIEAGDFFRELHQAGKLHLDFQPLDLDVGYHTPCHLRALGRGTPFRDLLELIPKLRVHAIEKGCSGMAGAYGLSAANFRNSLRIGRGLMSRMRQNDLQAGVTECSSCKFQMEQGTTLPTIHPLKLLALSYGLMPEISRKLKHGPRRHVVT
ncbi:MAG: anaerobic glycerol-3-phosphate dehydrogenase subunit C [Planctomycetales bacterium]